MHFFIFVCINDCTYNNGGMYQNYYIRTSISFFLRTGAGGSGRGWCGRDYNGDLLFDRKCDTMTMSSQKVLNFCFLGLQNFIFFLSSFLVVVVTGPGATCTESL
jgi:hypothetical protein